MAKLEGIVASEFVRMDYGEAIAVLERAQESEKFEFPVKWGIDLQSEHERYLTEKHAKKPVIVMNYPKEIKAFYMRVNDDGKTVAAMDVLAPGIGEIIGGSQREERLDVLDARMTERGIDKEHTAGTAICAATAPCPTPASGWASSARSPTSPDFRMSVTRSRFRARRDMRGTEGRGGSCAAYASPPSYPRSPSTAFAGADKKPRRSLSQACSSGNASASKSCGVARASSTHSRSNGPPLMTSMASLPCSYS